MIKFLKNIIATVLFLKTTMLQTSLKNLRTNCHLADSDAKLYSTQYKYWVYYSQQIENK